MEPLKNGFQSNSGAASLFSVTVSIISVIDRVVAGWTLTLGVKGPLIFSTSNHFDGDTEVDLLELYHSNFGAPNAVSLRNVILK